MTLVLFICLLASAQVLPQATPKPRKTPGPKPAQIVVKTSPGAQVYLDGQLAGRARAEGRLELANPKAGVHMLRISLASKRDYEQQVTIAAGQESRIEATLADVERPILAAGTVRENPRDGLKYVWIPPGTFMMGCSPGDNQCQQNEEPSHQVKISKGFWIGQTEVTIGAYKRSARGTEKSVPLEVSAYSGWTSEALPIINVTWVDAEAYCAWAGGRLPTEAEWEYAARGGSTEARYGPTDEVAWYEGNSSGRGHEVGQKRPNGFGLFDTLGNVWEWVRDWYDDKYYQHSPSEDPPGPSTGLFRDHRGKPYHVLRGGSWNDPPSLARVSYRNFNMPFNRGNVLGFRCVWEASNP